MYANTIFSQGPNARVLVIWIDASVQQYPPTKHASRLYASAIRFLDPVTGAWKEFVTFNTLPYGSKFALEAEFIAMSEAFRFACDLTEHFDCLVVFSDCHSMLWG
jgi:hypothetical protein